MTHLGHGPPVGRRRGVPGGQHLDRLAILPRGGSGRFRSAARAGRMKWRWIPRVQVPRGLGMTHGETVLARLQALLPHDGVARAGQPPGILRQALRHAQGLLPHRFDQGGEGPQVVQDLVPGPQARQGDRSPPPAASPQPQLRGQRRRLPHGDGPVPRDWPKRATDRRGRRSRWRFHHTGPRRVRSSSPLSASQILTMPRWSREAMRRPSRL